MTCRKAAQFIDDFIDDGIDDLLQQDILEHTETCEKCRATFDEMGRLKALLESFSTPLPDRDYFNQVSHLILARVNGKSESVSRIH